MTATNQNLIYSTMACLYVGCFVILGMLFGFTPLIYGLFAALAVIFVMPSPFLGLGLIVLMTMLFERWFTLQPLVTEYAAYKFYPLDIILTLTLLGWLLSQLFRERKKLIFGLAEKLLLAFIALNFIYLARAFFDFNADFSVAFSTFKNYAFYPLLYFLILYTVQTKREFTNLIHLIMLGGALLVGFLVIGVVRGGGLWTEYTPLSTAGVRLLAGTHAFYLVLTTLLATGLLAYNRFRNRGFAGLLIAVWLAGIAAALMRHLWLALAVGLAALLILIPLANRKNLFKVSAKGGLLIISLALIAVLAASLFPGYGFAEYLNDSYLVLSERVASVAGGVQDTSINWRVSFWQAAKRQWLEQPLIGLGFGRQLALELADWQTFEEIRNIHNSLLAIAVQLGLLGIGLFGACLVAIIGGSLRAIFNNEELKPYYFGLLAAVAAFLVASLFQPYLETNLTGIFLWIILGLIRTSVVIK